MKKQPNGLVSGISKIGDCFPKKQETAFANKYGHLQKARRKQLLVIFPLIYRSKCVIVEMQLTK